jgi:hypothetical protein
MAEQLTPAQINAIVSALRTAAEIYRSDARTYGGVLNQLVADQFRKQSIEALELAEILENANAVEVC